MSTARHAHRRHRHRPKGPATAQEIQERPENAWLAGDQRSEESVAPPSAVPVPPRPEVAVPISPDATEDKKDHSSLDRKRLVPPGFQAHQPGSEPGFDFLKEEHEAAPSRAKITLVEYSEKRIEMKSFVSAERLGDFLDEEEAIEGLEPATERKAKEGVRWIHVEGIDYEALKVLGLKYELHPLGS